MIQMRKYYNTDNENKPPQSRLRELKPFNVKQGYFENLRKQDEFHEFLTMTKMTTPRNRTPIVRKHKESDSSSSENSEKLDYTISPKTKLFPDKISASHPQKR